MTLDDITDLLLGAVMQRTVTRQRVDRCVLLAYELGQADRETCCDGMHAPDCPHREIIRMIDQTGLQTRWLAEMGYATWRHWLVTTDTAHDYRSLPATLDETPPTVQEGWRYAAAAIRRRVVNWQLPAEEERPDAK